MSYDATRRPALLLVEDFDALARVIWMRFSERFDVDVTSTLREALHQAARGSYDAVLLDLGLPDASGMESLESMLAVQQAPIIVVTGSDDEALHVQAIRAGAHDVVTKDGDVNGLLRRIVYAIERHTCLEDSKCLELILCSLNHAEHTMRSGLPGEGRARATG